jgi:hypothetical protein
MLLVKTNINDLKSRFYNKSNFEEWFRDLEKELINRFDDPRVKFNGFTFVGMDVYMDITIVVREINEKEELEIVKKINRIFRNDIIIAQVPVTRCYYTCGLMWCLLEDVCGVFVPFTYVQVGDDE